MVRQSRHTVEVLGQARDHAQVGVAMPGRIGAGAMQEGDGGAGLGRRLHGLGDLAGARHAGGDDQRPARTRRAADQRQVDGLERSDLEGRRLQTLQKLDRRLVEGRGEADHPARPRALEKGLVPLEGRERLRIEVVERAAGPQAAFDHEARPAMIQRDGVGGIGLQLDRVGAGFGGGVDQRQRPLQPAIVVARQLGDHERRLIRPDRASCDGESLGQRELLQRTGPRMVNGR